MAAEVGSQSVVVVLDVQAQQLGGGLRGLDAQRHASARASIRSRLPREAEAARRRRDRRQLDRQRRPDEGLRPRARARSVQGSDRVPITVLGGAGSLADIGKLIAACGVVGAAAGSLFVFKGAYRAVLINYPAPRAKG